MVKVNTDTIYVKPNGKEVEGFYLDAYLKDNLDFLKKQVEHKWDGVGLIAGQVGSGKTTLSHAIAHYLDPSFNLDRVVFNGKDLMKAIDTASKGQAIVFDEAVMALSSQDFANELQKTLIKKFTLIRSKNLYILLIIPNFFLMRRWFCIDRTKFMIYCYSPDGLSRGYFRFYSWNRKKKLYLLGYKTMDIGCVKPNFPGRFINTEGYFLDIKDYETKKQEAVKSLTEADKSDKEKLQEQFKDYKLKLQIEIKQWKEKIKEKYQQRCADWRGKYKQEKQHKKDAIEEIKKEVVFDIEREFSKIIYFFYEREKASSPGLGDNFTYKTFMKLLEDNKVTDKTWRYYKKFYESGKELSKL